ANWASERKVFCALSLPTTYRHQCSARRSDCHDTYGRARSLDGISHIIICTTRLLHPGVPHVYHPLHENLAYP
ncbi:hypothetical protein BDR04DRAFT_1138232, partial [Suillus decipiens]